MSTKTEVWYPENAKVEIYTHVEKEAAGSTIDGTNVDFTLAHAAAAVTGIAATGSPLAQFVSATDKVGRRDAYVMFRKGGTDTAVDTATNAISFEKAGSKFTFGTAPTVAQADSIVVSYGYTKADKTHEVTSVAESGGDRPVEYLQTYGGYKIKTEKPQEDYTVDIEVLKEDLGFAEMVCGAQTAENISGTASIYTVMGGETRASKVLAIKNTDPTISNRMVLVYWNVSGVSKTIDAPADGNYTEALSFSTKPADKVEIYWEKA